MTSLKITAFGCFCSGGLHRFCFLKILFVLPIHACFCGCDYVCAGTCRSQRGGAGSQKAGVAGGVSHLMGAGN